MSKKPRSIFRKAGGAIWNKLLETYEPELFERRQVKKREKHRRRSKERSDDSQKGSPERKGKEHPHPDSRHAQQHRAIDESENRDSTSPETLLDKAGRQSGEHKHQHRRRRKSSHPKKVYFEGQVASPSPMPKPLVEGEENASWRAAQRQATRNEAEKGAAKERRARLEHAAIDATRRVREGWEGEQMDRASGKTSKKDTQLAVPPALNAANLRTHQGTFKDVEPTSELNRMLGDMTRTVIEGMGTEEEVEEHFRSDGFGDVRNHRPRF